MNTSFLPSFLHSCIMECSSSCAKLRHEARYTTPQHLQGEVSAYPPSLSLPSLFLSTYQIPLSFLPSSLSLSSPPSIPTTHSSISPSIFPSLSSASVYHRHSIQACTCAPMCNVSQYTEGMLHSLFCPAQVELRVFGLQCCSLETWFVQSLTGVVTNC